MRASKQRWMPGNVGRLVWRLCLLCVTTFALSAQCTNPTQVPNGTYTSGDHSQVDSNALSASSFSVSQAATATFAAGNCIHLGPGFRANAVGATAATTFHSWVDVAPSAVSFSPSEQSGLSQTFMWTISSPPGNSNVSHVFALFHTTATTTANACYIHYDPASNLIYLANDASDNWLGGFAPGSSGSASNSQCTISGAGASVSPAGAQLTVQVPVTFKAAFAGTKNEYLYALDSSGITTGWMQMGHWTVPAPPVPDFTVDVTPRVFYIQTGVTSAVSYQLTITPTGGFNSSLAVMTFTAMYGCTFPGFNPIIVNGPPWTSTATMQCTESLPNYYFVTVTVSGGGKAHDVNLELKASGNVLFYLTTSVSPPGAGTISPGSGPYPNGTVVPLVATAAAGYTFASFTGATTSNGSSGSVTMLGNQNVVANFSPQTQTAAPVFNPVGGTYNATQNVTITSPTQNAQIRYTIDGTTPTSTTGLAYTGAIRVDSSTTIKAIAYKAGLTDSVVSVAGYTISRLSVATPTFSPAGGTYTSSQTVTIDCVTADAHVRYTLDGTTPTPTTGISYTGAITVGTSMTIKAIAYKSEMTDSAVAMASYTISQSSVATPTFSPAGGTYTSAQSVTLNCVTANAKIRYTTDGTDPSATTGTEYSGPITVTKTTTIKAIAVKDGMTSSSVASATYTIREPFREYIRLGGRIIAIENN